MIEPLVVVDALFVVTLVTAGLTAVARRPELGTTGLGITAGCLAVVAVLDVAVRLRVAAIETLFGGVRVALFGASIAWLWFAVEHTGRGPELTRRRLFGGTGAAVALVFATQLPVSVIRYGSAAIINISATYGSVAGTFLLSQATLKRKLVPLWQGVLLPISGSSLVLIGFVASLTPLQDGVVQNLVLASALGSGVPLAASVFTEAAEDTTKQARLARGVVLEGISEAVIVTDTRGSVIYSNETAQQVFLGTESRDAFGRDFESLVGVRPDELRDTAVDRELTTESGRRWFEVTHSPMTERKGDRTGNIYIFRDVTARRSNQQRRNVLVRLLRHNLRNKVDVIRAHAELLADQPERGTRIANSAGELATMSETVTEMDHLLSQEQIDRERIEVGELVRKVGEQIAEEFGGTVTVDAEPVTLYTSREAVQTVVAELVSNGMKHAEMDEPPVRISVRASAEHAVVTIEDAGPGIPEQEYAVLGSVEQSQLRHGRGLGIWMVQWIVTRLGGTLSFDADSSGTVVTVRLPRGDGERDARSSPPYTHD
ncbi:ATP-binding protein [Candidatus Halobonum tyrrellensis]|uniref:histidine kinase n=1 Tax=Candidatus Halobonum tyrrellensis G22 TaxID=1324957 RepID=V4GX03_9EURY|nr:ATP-binding protein [Candidatus Halobonum tyrrellensis]ESP89706.1 histidine kinase [Candidatus Halobonum tyrrellensis G22]